MPRSLPNIFLQRTSLMEQEEISEIYSAAQKLINKYADESGSAPKGEDGAQKNVAQTPKRESSSREASDLSREIQRAVRRATDKGRTERLNEAAKAQQDQRNYTNNSSPNSSIYESPAQNAPVKIRTTEPPPRRVPPPKPPMVEDKIDFVSSNCIGLAVYKRGGEVWVSAGTVAGQVPSEFDPEDGKSIASGGTGDVWAEVNIDGTTGDIVSVDVNGGGTTPDNTDTSFYYPLGYYEYSSSTSVTNYGCGSIDVTVCRNWFAAEAPFYGVTMTRCGCGGY